MKIDIQTHGFEIDSGLNHFAMCCAAFELGPHKGQIDSVRIQLDHVPEARDRKDRHCQVEIDLRDGNRISTRDKDLDMHVAIYRALERAGWMSTRRLSGEDLAVVRLPVPQPQAPNSGEPNWAA